jgi:autotransporter-associated beta strand protein
LSATSVAENAASGTVVGTLLTTDPDAGNTFTYSLVAGTGDTDNASFSIVGNQLRTALSFNYESKSSYTIRVRTTDQAGLTYERSFPIFVMNVNETPTDIALSAATVAENQPSGTVVGTLSATDPDAIKTFTYSLVSGTGSTDNASFSIVGTSLRTAGSFNFEAKNSYSIRVRVTDQGGLTFEKAFTISVTDVNEAPTNIALSVTSVAENQPVGTVLGTFTTADQDVGNTFTYALVTGTGSADNASFMIVGNELRTAASFDFEAKSSYAVRIRSTDSDGLITETPFAISVTNVNETPVDISLSSKAIAENAGANAIVGNLGTSDVDVGDVFFAYTLVSGTGSTDNAAFNISGNQLRANASLNFEAKSDYSVRVRATDQGGLFTEKVFAITVTDVEEASAFLFAFKHINEAGADRYLVDSTGMRKYSEWQSPPITYWGPAANNVEGRLVYAFPFASPTESVRLLAHSPSWNFFVEAGGSGRGASALEVSRDGITWSNLRNSLEPRQWGADWTYDDYLPAGVLGGTELWVRMRFLVESAPNSSYTVTQFGRSTSAATANVFEVRAALATNSPPAALGLSETSIAENAGANAVVGTLSTTDANSGDTFTYALVAGAGSADNALFAISGDTLRATTNFDYETKDRYSIRVRSTDAAGLSTEKAFTITVTDVNEAPTVLALTATTTSLAEDADTSSRIKVADIVVTDDALGANGLSLTGAEAGSFEIDGTSLYLKAGVSLNYEAKTSYAVTVSVADDSVEGSTPVTADFTLGVTNVNEGPSDVALSAATVAENAAIGTVVGSLSTTDVDASDTFTYTLVSGDGDTDNASFEIVGDAIKTLASFNYEAKSSYTVRVRSTDAAGLFTEKAFAITVTDVNEAPTALALTGQTTSLTEDADTSSRIKVADIVVTDDALGTNVLTLSGADAGSFEIDGTSLYLKAGVTLNYEAKSSYAVTVNVADASVADSTPATADFALGVTNVNEGPSDVSLSAASVAENATVGTVVGTLTTTDVDAGDTFTYTLVSGSGDTDNASFEIGGNALKTLASFNYESRSSYTVRVRSTDAAGLFTEKAFAITVTDVNEAPTEIALSSSIVAENAAVGTVVGTLSSTDSDAGNTITYALVSGEGDADNASFEIVGDAIKTLASFNYEAKSSYTVRVRSTDQAGLASDKVFTISVTNVNESPVDITLSATTIAENLAAGTTVGTLLTIDPDAGDAFTYTLVSGDGSTDNAAFTIVGNTVKTAASFNYEGKNSYSIRVRSTDTGALFAEKAFTITVTDVSEPLVISGTTLAENVPAGTLVGSLARTDAFASNTPLTVFYIPSTGQMLLRNTTSSPLAIQSVTLTSPGQKLNQSEAVVPSAAFTTTNYSDGATYGQYSEIFFAQIGTTALTLAANASWNYGFVAEAGLTRSGLEAAFSTDPEVDFLPGSSAGQFLYTLIVNGAATDPVRGQIAHGLSEFTYSLVAGDGDIDNALFTIDADGLRTNGALDFETRSQYSVRIRSTDADGLFTEDAFTITLTNVNDAPTDVTLSSSSVAENQPAGTAIGTLTSSDPDAGDTFSYTLVSGEGSTDNASFQFVGNELQATATFNAEAKSSYSVRIRTADQGGLSTEKAFTITVTNVNEGPSDVALSAATVAENAAVGTVVGSLSTTDVDTSDTFTYTLVSGDGDTDNVSFEIVGDALKTLASFDYEVKSSCTVRIRSTDASGLSTEKAFTITVTDVNEAPTAVALTGTTTSLAEDADTSSRIQVATIVVTDDALGANVLTLSGADATSFEIDGTSLYLKAGATLNYEAKSSYAVTVNVADDSVAGSTPATADFTLGVTNVNEGPSDVALSAATVAENAAVGTVVGSLSTTDVDAGDTFTYTLVSGSGDTDFASFEIVGNALKTLASFDYEAKSSYTVRVRSTDAGGLSTEQAFTIAVTDVNEAPTAVALIGTTTSLAEDADTSSRIKVADIVVTDDALGTNVFSLAGADASSFEIDGASLYLKAGVTFNYEVKSSYAVTVNVADDSVAGSTPATADFTLGVTNVNEGPSDVALTVANVAENAAVGTVVGSLSTTDVDAGDTFTYTLVSGSGDTDNASFEIVGDAIKTLASFNYEARSSYTVRVRSTDAAGLSTEKAFTITVTDVNEAPTAVALTGTTTSLAEDTDTSSRIKLADIVVTDDALGTNVLSLTGADAGSFEIDGTSLYLKAGVALNHEAKTSYAVTVSVADDSVAGSTPMTADFTLGVTNVNEGPSDVSLSAASVAENATVGTVVGALSTSDVDASDTFTYALVSGAGSTDNASFEIVGNALKTLASFDYEAKSSYTVRVRSADAAGLFTEKAFTIAVTDVNEAPTAVALNGTTTSLAEDADTSSRIQVATIVVTDDALGSNVLTLTGADSGSFEIDGTSLYLKAGVGLNYEVKSSYAVTVNVADASVAGSTPVTASFTLTILNVNARPTDLVLSAVTVAENAPAGTAVGALSSTDPDSGDTFTYALVAGTGSTDNASFTIVGNQVRTAATFDYEAKNSYTIRVRSTDAGGLSAEKAFTISVTNVNEAPTAVGFSNALTTLPESTSTASRVKMADIVVTDDDVGSNVFSLSGADAASFEIVGSALYLKAGVSLDYGTKASFDVKVDVLDTTALYSFAPTPITIVYSSSNGNLLLRNTADSPVAVASVWIVSPTNALSGVAATVPVAAFTTLNTDPLGVQGVSSEIFFANVGSSVITLAAGGSWNLGNAATAGMTVEQLFHAFTTDADSDPEGSSANGRFLYSVSDDAGGAETARGAIIRDVSTTFSIGVTNVPAFSGREYVDIVTGQSVTDTQSRSGARQIVVRGGGTLVLTGANTHTGGTRVESGQLVVKNTGALGAGTLTIKDGARVTLDIGYGRASVGSVSLDPTARIDLGRGGLLIASGGITTATLRGYLLSSRNGGLWEGYGIGSANAKSVDNRAIGYRISGGVTQVAWAAFGDVNLDGRVNASDVSLINSGRRYGLSSTAGHWYEGDFSYDGRVNSTDISLLQRLFNKGFYNTVVYGSAFTSDGKPVSLASQIFVTSAINGTLPG